MKRVRMLMTETGRHPDMAQYHCLIGHEYVVPNDLAAAWIAKRVAEPATKKQPDKTTVTKPTKDKE